MLPKAARQTVLKHQPNDTPRLANLVTMENPSSVFAEVKKIVLALDPGLDVKPIENVFHDIVKLFSGQYPGYRKCNTRYHDLKHTTDTLLAMARLIHGAQTNGITLQKRDILLGLVAALMHDVGYIQQASETRGTGAQFAQVHIARGIAFMRSYLKNNGFSSYDYRKCRTAVLCTDLNLPITSIAFKTQSNARMGKMLATADLIGQTADRCYLEKLRFLYQEFREAEIKAYNSEIELLEDSLIFNEHMKGRLAKDLDGVDHYLTGHFQSRWGIGKNLYHESINNNLSYLKCFLKDKNKHYSHFLNRMEAP
ncbi:MAG: hypothetical protein ABFS43_15590 [Thermodesulfobacteriota bacterium]